MSEPRVFDYHLAAEKAGITVEQLHGIERAVRRCHPTDHMLFELHVLRACHAVETRRATIGEVQSESWNEAESGR